MSVLNTQKVYGNLFDLGLSPESAEKITICLSEPLVLYGEDSQLIGDESTVDVDEFGDWEADLVDTDGMENGVYYSFEIAGRIYKKYAPVSVQDWLFVDLPDA